MLPHHGFKGNHRGLGVVELVITAAVMVLLAVFICQLTELVQDERAVSCAANIAVLNSMAAQYLVTNGSIAPSLEDLGVDAGIPIPKCPFDVPYSFDGYRVTNAADHEH